MWAVQYGRYGGPEVLGLGRAPRPRVGRADVLVRVAAFSINHLDVVARQGKMRGLNGFGFPKGTGHDFAGEVVEVGAEVSGFHVGDRVWGYLGMRPPGAGATAAEFVAVRAKRIALAPSIPLPEAAALPLVGLTAVQALRGALRVTAGKRVLVVGGSGGVGSTAIQVAAALGADVDAIVGSGRADVAERAGAHRTWEYRRVRAQDMAERYDAILDTAAANLRAYRRLLNRRGRMAVLSPAAIPAVAYSLITPGPRIRMISAAPRAVDLQWLAAHVDAGRISPIIEASYGIEHVADAHRDFETGSAGGKRIVRAA